MSNTHVHSYQRIGKERNFSVKEDRKIYYRCTNSTCFHKMNAIELVGKRCLCSRCGDNVFTLTRADLSKAIPVCPGCSNTREGKLVAKGKELVSSLLEELEEKVI